VKVTELKDASAFLCRGSDVVAELRRVEMWNDFSKRVCANRGAKIDDRKEWNR